MGKRGNSTQRNILILFLCLFSIYMLPLLFEWSDGPASTSPEIFVDRMIRDNPVVVFSKTYCSYSKALKKLLWDYPGGIRGMKVVEINTLKSAEEIETYLQTLSGRDTVPQLFINGKFYGGHDETKRADELGLLKKALITARAI